MIMTVDSEPVEDGQIFRSNEDLDASGDAGLTANEAISFECHDHLVDRGWTDLKMALHVGLGGRASEHVRVDVDESQILTLLFGEALSPEAASGA
jgi:hypothetical protein